MGVELVAPLAVLALIDSTSFGTLVIPIWLMMAPRLRAHRVLVFLATVGTFYLLLGVALTAGAMAFLDRLNGALDGTPGHIAQFVVGVILFVLGLTIEPWTKEGKRKRAERRQARRGGKPSRIQVWRERAAGGDGAVTGVVVLALIAAAIEAASMLPYLAAIGIISSSDLSPSSSVVVLAAYCLVMITPALVLLAARVTLHERITPTLTRLDAWLSRNSGEALAWILAIVGFHLSVNAAYALGWFS